MLLLKVALELQNCWLGLRCRKLSRLFRKKKNKFDYQAIIRICKFWHFPPIKIALRGTKWNNRHSPKILQVIRKSTDTLMKEMQPLVFEESRVVFQEKPDHLQLLAISVQVRDAMTFSGKVILERCSADENLLFETLIPEIEKVVLKRFESVYQDD